MRDQSFLASSSKNVRELSNLEHQVKLLGDEEIVNSNHPDAQQICYDCGIQSLRMGKYNAAEKNLKKVLEFKNNTSHVIEKNAAFKLLELYIRKLDFDNALKSCDYLQVFEPQYNFPKVAKEVISDYKKKYFSDGYEYEFNDQKEFKQDA